MQTLAALHESLVAAVGMPAAKEIFFTARRFSAEEALRMGLVNQVLPKADLETAVREIAQRIAGYAPLTLRSVKRIVSELLRPPAERDSDRLDGSVRACMESEDYRDSRKRMKLHEALIHAQAESATADDPDDYVEADVRRVNLEVDTNLLIGSDKEVERQLVPGLSVMAASL